MIEKLRRGVIVGIGIASLTRKRAEPHIKRLVKTGRLSASQGKRLVDNLVKEFESHRRRAASLIDAELKAAEREGIAVLKSAKKRQSPKKARKTKKKR